MGVLGTRNKVSVKMTTPEVECALVSTPRGVFNHTRYLVVPRTSYALNFIGIHHECDMLALSRANVLHEIEIKVSKSDLLADARKRHTHKAKNIRRFWFAVPSSLVSFALSHIPADAGLIECYAGTNGRFYSQIVRKASVRGKTVDKDITLKFHEILSNRYWAERIRIAKKVYGSRINTMEKL